MKKLLLIPVLFLSLLSSPSWGEDYDNLVSRDGIYYKKFTNTPFTGRSEGKGQGLFVYGKREGPWRMFWPNGGLFLKGNWKNGKHDGYFEYYWDNGMLNETGHYVNGKKEGEWVGYWDNGQLADKGTYKNGKKEGLWLMYKVDGIRHEFTGVYKDGVKISD